MNKLIFSLASYRSMGLSFSTHRSSRISIQPGQTIPMNISDDEDLTPEQLVEFYDSHYKRDGLTTKYLASGMKINGTSVKDLDKKDDEKISAPNSSSTTVPVVPPISVPDATPKTEEKVDNKPEEALKTEGKTDEKADNNAEPSTEGKTDEKADNSVASWDFEKMKAFVAENNIEVKGRSKNDYITAIEAFIKSKED